MGGIGLVRSSAWSGVWTPGQGVIA